MKTMKQICIIGFILLVFSMIFGGCASQKEKQERVILKYVQQNFDMDMQKDNCVFIIAEKGCIGCNKELSKFASQFVDMQRVYYILNAKGTIVDISPYWEAKKQEQISTDSLKYFDKNELPDSYAIFIKNGKVDTILLSSADKVFDTEQYVIKRIEDNR